MDRAITDSTKLQSLHDWLGTPLGAHVLAREQAWLDEVTPDIFGYHAVQLGLPQVDLLRESRIVHKLHVDPAPGAPLQAHFHELPIATHSVDLAVLPHVLEFAEKPHDILREIDRIMIPEGRLILIGFNPWSFYGVRRLLDRGDEVPWNARFLSLVRLRDWLSLLGFDVADGHLACYAPPFRNPAWLNRFRFMEKSGQRWWGVAGGVYMLQAVKRVRGMRIITPEWSHTRRAERKFAAAAKSQEAARTGSHLTLVK